MWIIYSQGLNRLGEKNVTWPLWEAQFKRLIVASGSQWILKVKRTPAQIEAFPPQIQMVIATAQELIFRLISDNNAKLRIFKQVDPATTLELLQSSYGARNNATADKANRDSYKIKKKSGKK
jgi:hypothetical protein